MDSMFHTNEENEEVDQRLLHMLPPQSIARPTCFYLSRFEQQCTGTLSDPITLLQVTMIMVDFDGVGDFDGDGDFDVEVGAGDGVGDGYIRSPFNRCQYPQKNPFSNHH